jgi:hypothetical protein
MANLTQYAQKKLLDHTLNLASWTMPTVHAALFTASPGEAGSLANEVVGGSYGRIELTSKMSATTLATGIATNSSVVTFATPSGTWGLLTYLGICDAASAGNILMYTPLQYPFLIQSGSVAPSFPIGTISLSALLTGATSGLTQYLGKKWLDHLLGKASFTAPADCYLGFFSADPTSAGSLTNEIATGGYARQNISDIMSAAELATGMSVNGANILFPAPTADYNVTYFAVLDALTVGNMLIRKARGSTLRALSGSAGVRVDVNGLRLFAD